METSPSKNLFVSIYGDTDIVELLIKLGNAGFFTLIGMHCLWFYYWYACNRYATTIVPQNPQWSAIILETAAAESPWMNLPDQYELLFQCIDSATNSVQLFQIMEEEEGLETVIHFIWKIAGGCVSWFICVPTSRGCSDKAEHL